MLTEEETSGKLGKCLEAASDELRFFKQGCESLDAFYLVEEVEKFRKTEMEL
jgi:hypothetical protein